MADVRKTSDLLIHVLERNPDDRITLGTLVTALGDRTFGLVILVLALPGSIPGVPVIPTIFAIPIILIGIQLMIGRPSVWLPAALAGRSFNRRDLLGLVRRTDRYVKLFEALCRPRLMFMTGPVGERLLGFIIVVLASVAAIPLPLTNTLPSIAVGVIALGLIEDDGLIALGGIVCGLIAAASVLTAYGAVILAGLSMLR